MPIDAATVDPAEISRFEAIAAATATAEVSEPPRPSVVMRPVSG